jgi:mitochondrial fission protein ELM1
MPFNSQVTCWVVTDGKSGMENQCIGLAEALGLAPAIKRVKLRAPWRFLAPWLKFGLGCAFDKAGDDIAPPWPDLLIATGRQSIPAALHIKNQNPRCFTVQLQDPVIDPAHFDLVIVPRHDKLRGANVISTRGALHRVTPAMLASEAEKLRAQVAHLPSPRIAVLIGGSNAVFRLTPAEMMPIAAQLAAVAKSSGGSLLVTPSRRTGDENLAVLKNALRDVPAYIWDGQGANPYYGMLGLADYILATCDSVNMISEACTTGKPAYVIDLPGGSAKFSRFHDALRAEGLTRAFEGRLEKWNYTPLDDVQMVAAKIGEKMRNERQ